MSDTGNDAPIPTDPAAVSSEIGELETKMRDTRAWAADTGGQERVRQLYEAQEAGGEEVQEPAPKSGRMLEIEALMSDTMGPYYRGPEAEKLQAEYRSLAEADVRGLDADQTSSENVTAWSDYLQVEPEQVLDMMQRAEQITAEVGDTSELETAFSGLPDRVQWVCRRALAAPERRQELADSLSDSDYQQLENFFESMTPEEAAAVQKVLRS